MNIFEWLEQESKYSIQQWHEQSHRHTLGGCFAPGDKQVFVHAGILRAIQNWCGNCIDPANGPDYYYDQRAMWEALNMIYQLIEETRDAPQRYEVKWADQIWEIPIPQIKSINPNGSRSQEETE